MGANKLHYLTLFLKQSIDKIFCNKVLKIVYLLTDDALFDGGSLEVYGVEILLYRSGVQKPEIARLRGITPLGRRILDILQQLSDGAVTPSALGEVMDSILARG